MMNREQLLERMNTLLTSLHELNDHDCAVVLSISLFSLLNFLLNEEISDKVLTYIYDAIPDHIERVGAQKVDQTHKPVFH
jgi:hypothetical protein